MEFLLTIAVAHFLAVASPGPDFFLVVRNALRSGFRIGVLTSAGIMIGVAIQLLLCLSGLSLLLVAAPGGMTAISLAGAAYLTWLGWQAIRDSRRQVFAPAGTGHAPGRPVREGLLCNLSNPKAILFFLGLFSVLLTPAISVPLRFAAALQILAVNFLWFSFVAAMVARTGRHPRFIRFQRAGLALTGIVLWALAARLIWSLL